MKTFFLFALVILGFSFTSCQKCFTCSNKCVVCQLKDSADVVLASRTLCSDSTLATSYAHDIARKDSFINRGYVCSETASSTKKDFCTNSAGADQYKNYYNSKQFDCKSK